MGLPIEQQRLFLNGKRKMQEGQSSLLSERSLWLSLRPFQHTEVILCEGIAKSDTLDLEGIEFHSQFDWRSDTLIFIKKVVSQRALHFSMSDIRPCKMSVLLLIPGGPIINVFVSPNDQCRVLRLLFPKRMHFTFLYQGQRMDERQTMAFYGVEPNSTIIALKEHGQSNCTVEEWLKFSSDNNGFRSFVASIMDDKTRGEAMRVRDLALMKREIRPRRMRHLVCPSFITEPATPCDFPTKLNYDTPTEPSVAPLPTQTFDSHSATARATSRERSFA
jgi:hypothetical protein